MIFRTKKYNRYEWHISFALTPKRTIDGEIVWLQSVERIKKSHGLHWIGPGEWYEYRILGCKWDVCLKELKSDIEKIKESNPKGGSIDHGYLRKFERELELRGGGK